MNRSTNMQYFNVHNYNVETVSEFSYRAPLMSDKSTLTMEIISRLVMANKFHRGLRKQLRTHCVKARTKCNSINVSVTCFHGGLLTKFGEIKLENM